MSVKVWAVLAAMLVVVPSAEAATVKVTVGAPTGVPATVTVGKQTLAKAPGVRTKTFGVRAGRVKAPTFAFNGVLYEATVKRYRVTYRAAPVAKRLTATSIAATKVTLDWAAPKGAAVRLRRTIGERPARSVRDGVKASKTDSGLKAGTKYTYALFTKTKRGWAPPLTILVSTVSRNPAVATYVAPPSTVIVKPGAADRPTVTPAGVSVRLAGHRATPVIGAGFVMPVSSVLPGGFLGKVASVSADGRTVQLAPAAFADAFDYYKLNLDLGKTKRARTSQTGVGPVACPGGSQSTSVVFKPVIEPDGHFDAEVVKSWFVPVGARFDLSVQLEVGLKADIDVSGALECGVGWHFIYPIVLEPVPISIDLEAEAKASIGAELSTRNLGYTVTSGFWTRGEFGKNNSIDGGLIREAGPTSATATLAFPQVRLSLGGDVTVGPGLGTPAAGVIAGVGGTFTPIEGTFSPLFNLLDRRVCLKTTLGGSAALAVNAKAWLGDFSFDRTFTVDALEDSWDYGGPWYWPNNCEKEPEPTPTPSPNPQPGTSPTPSPSPDPSATPSSTPGGPIATVSPEPTVTPVPTPYPAGGGWGDPHLFTYDGLTYDFQGAGEYVLAEGPGFAVHGRFARPAGTHPAVTFNHSVAARVGSSILAFGDDGAKALGAARAITLDGQAVSGPRDLPGGAKLAADGTVTWPDGTTLERLRTIGDTVTLRPGSALRGHLRGLLGDADGNRSNDLLGRDGTPVTNVGDPAQLYGAFGASWRVTTGSLFTTPLPDEIGSPATPAEPITLATLPTAAREAAEQACRAKGLLPGAGLEGCMLDVGVTGDASLADQAAAVSAQLEGSVDAASLTPATTRTTLTLGAETAGSLATPLAPRVYLVAAQAGTPLTVGVAECPAGGSFQIAVIAPDGTPLDRTGGTGCGSLTIPSVPASGVYELRAVDPGGFTGAFRFTATGTPYALGPNGSLALPAGTWRFTAAAGQRVFVDGDATVDGAPTPLTLSGGGTHTLTLAGSGTLYGIRDRPTVTWSGLDAVTLAGSAERVGALVRLTPAEGNRAGALWSNVRIDPRGDLHTAFTLNLHDGSGVPADGIALVLTDPAQPLTGGLGIGIGYAGLTPSLALEFDIYTNAGEPNANQIELTRNGQRLTTFDPGFPLYGAGPVYGWLDYTEGTVRIYVSQAPVKPAMPMSSVTTDVGRLLGRTARIGLTGATGGSWAQQDVLGWTLSNETLPGHTG